MSHVWFYACFKVRWKGFEPVDVSARYGPRDRMKRGLAPHDLTNCGHSAGKKVYAI